MMEKHLSLLPGPEISAVGHFKKQLAKITVALTPCHKRQNSYPRPSINVPLVIRVESASQQEARSQSAERHRRVGNRAAVVLWISISARPIGT